MYNGMIIKINTAGEALKSILDMRRGPSLGIGSTIVGSAIWSANSMDLGYNFLN